MSEVCLSTSKRASTNDLEFRFRFQGPKSRAILQTLTDADLSNEAFPFSSNQTIQVAGRKVSFPDDFFSTASRGRLRNHVTDYVIM
jgi:hypothetical protein